MVRSFIDVAPWKGMPDSLPQRVAGPTHSHATSAPQQSQPVGDGKRHGANHNDTMPPKPINGAKIATGRVRDQEEQRGVKAKVTWIHPPHMAPKKTNAGYPSNISPKPKARSQTNRWWSTGSSSDSDSDSSSSSFLMMKPAIKRHVRVKSLSPAFTSFHYTKTDSAGSPRRTSSPTGDAGFQNGWVRKKRSPTRRQSVSPSRERPSLSQAFAEMFYSDSQLAALKQMRESRRASRESMKARRSSPARVVFTSLPQPPAPPPPILRSRASSPSDFEPKELPRKTGEKKFEKTARNENEWGYRAESKQDPIKDDAGFRAVPGVYNSLQFAEIARRTDGSQRKLDVVHSDRKSEPSVVNNVGSAESRAHRIDRTLGNSQPSDSLVYPEMSTALRPASSGHNSCWKNYHPLSKSYVKAPASSHVSEAQPAALYMMSGALQPMFNSSPQLRYNSESSSISSASSEDLVFMAPTTRKSTVGKGNNQATSLSTISANKSSVDDQAPGQSSARSSIIESQRSIPQNFHKFSGSSPPAKSNALSWADIQDDLKGSTKSQKSRSSSRAKGSSENISISGTHAHSSHNELEPEWEVVKAAKSNASSRLKSATLADASCSTQRSSNADALNANPTTCSESAAKVSTDGSPTSPLHVRYDNHTPSFDDRHSNHSASGPFETRRTQNPEIWSPAPPPVPSELWNPCTSSLHPLDSGSNVTYHHRPKSESRY